ncbi:MAG TPA: LysR substrate-binding domain-containing protein [Sphingopyxis sp.]|uniref:LysR substrate-binding domain-containing protein n=1 Tax=Sphingopyxis sp. TaxID=1908224 RepID=UPI002CA15651|nr:LysR substrate-binding domain-containing protein [Sphingopyxis sp.]HWW58994.1 LysR substrate-binding domain-containing protein [Sphingopyxis sp.]
MDLRQLRFFVTLADTLNFHRAAARLHISQPPLSVAIRKLEEEIGTRLFDRTSRGVTLTPAGIAALPPAREALAQAALVHEAAGLGSRGQTGRLSVGFVGSAIGELLPRIIPPFRETHPLADLDLAEMTSVGIADAIEARALDVGLVRLPVMRRHRLDIAVIEEDDLVLAHRIDDNLQPRGPVPLRTLADRPFIVHSAVSVLHSVILLACRDAGFAPRIAQEAVQVQTILSLVQSGLGVALVPARMARFAPQAVRLTPLAEPVRISTGIACRADASPLARNFIRQALAAR